MPRYTKRDLPVHLVRRYLEPGPIVLVSSQHNDKRTIMSMGWHMIMEFEPSRIGCFITPANDSFELIRQSGECVINIPEAHLLDTVVAIGNHHGIDEGIDKFKQFGLTARASSKVSAPYIAECYAHFECKLADASLLKKYSQFVFEVVKARAAVSPKYPRTVHYRGEGAFMVSGRNVSRKARMIAQNL